jgi:hypothetical protein
MKKIFLFIIPVLILGCAKEELKIPTLAVSGIQELHDHSQVWMFFKVKNNDTIAKVNRKNTIISTHWIYNIDKRLPIRTIVHTLIKLKEKHSNSMHSKEGTHNYFSYSDTISKKLSFFEFDATVFKTDSLLSKHYIKEHSDIYKNYNNINLTFNPNNTWINDAKMESGELISTLTDFINFSSEGNQAMLHLSFNQNLLYQDYLYYKTMINNLSSSSILINNLEFIFDPKKVPDCGCE